MEQAIGYVRVSTTGQADDGVSLEMQEAKIRGYCELHGIELLAIHRDEGISGGKVSNRPGLQAALEGVVKHRAALVAYSLSRISRSTIDLLTLAERIQKANGDLVSLRERIDTGSPAGRVAFRIMSALAEFERETVAERTREAMQFKKAQGKRVGSIPYGSNLADDGESLEACEREQAVVKAVMVLRQQGYTLRAISDELARRGTFSRTGKPFHPQTVARILDAA
jgi:site-specific DNA recombinase